jgi:hypothetical protein
MIRNYGINGTCQCPLVSERNLEFTCRMLLAIYVNVPWVHVPLH